MDKSSSVEDRIPKYGLSFCFISFAAAWIYDFPQVISIPLNRIYNIPESTIMLCYSFYSFPNLLFVFLGGFIVNKYGPIIFLLCILIAFFGNSIFCLGV